MSKFELRVDAQVRYWEDAIVNGVQSEESDHVPFVNGEMWTPRIDLNEGKVIDWPQGTVAQFHFKVCDAGEYFLATDDGEFKWGGYYVPNEFLCHGDNGYGDYIIFNVDEDGSIMNYRKPEFDASDWKKVTA